MKEMDIKSTSSCTSSPKVNSSQYSFNEIETDFVRQKIENLIRKSVIVHAKHEPGELELTIFVSPEIDSGMRLIFNLKSLNKSVPYKKFKMNTISSILHLVRHNIFLTKLDKKDA